MRRMGIGLGVGINRSNYAQGIFSAYQSRVIADGGVTEAGACVDAVSGLLQTASLLLIPSGYKSGKAYAEIPTNGNGDLTWTRASDAWRTNADGLIQRVPWNLLQQSEDFTSGVWGKLSGTTVTANQTTAPNGTNTADLITEGTAVLLYYTTLTSAGTYTQSWYLKKGTGDIAAMYFGSGYSARYNLTLGTIVSTNNVTATITDVGNGWYRCTATATPTASFYAGLNYTNSSGLTIYAWGAQLVEGSSAQTYFPTTDRLNVPRLSYMYGSCPALLLEPQRTNLALYSEQFDNAYWTKNATSVTANTTTSPDGTTNADKIVENSALAEHFVAAGNITYAAGAYTISVYAKASERSVIQLFFNGSINIVAFANFDLANGVVGSTGSGTTATITSVGNGWYRCAITATCVLGTAPGLYYCIQTSTTATRAQTYTGNGTSGLFVWGAQLELGAYATTLIPTTTASATRIADSFSRNNIYTNGLITSSGGTWFVQFRVQSNAQRDNSNALRIGDANNSFDISGSTSGYGFIVGKVVSATYSNILFSNLGASAFVKLAIKWNGTTADVFANGTKVVSATSFTPTDLPNLSGSFGSALFIQAMGLHPTPLTDAQCIELTTL